MSAVKKIKGIILSYYYRIRELVSPSRIKSGMDIPIVINNFNRLSTLKQLIESLEKRGYFNIHILDNDSTYPPLFEYYAGCKYDVIKLGCNLGFKALWKDRAVRKRFCHDYYVYTDSDVVLSEECPSDVVDRIFRLLHDKYKFARKIGLTLRTDDLPDCYAHKQKVLDWESRYSKCEVNADGLYRAPTDTTFAVYRPRVGLSRSRFVEAYRIAAPYSLRHLPWYQDSDNPDEEERYYTQHCNRVTLWTSKNKLVNLR